MRIRALVATATIAAGLFAGCQPDEKSSHCQDVYAKHVDNAREFGYSPDARSTFLDRCEQGGRSLQGAQG